MVKIIIVGDVHFKDNYNIRKDDIVDILIKKIEQIISIAKEKKDNKIIFLGDFFDNYSISNIGLYKIIELIKKHKNIDFYSSYGNHDEKNNSKDLRGETTLNLLFKLGILRHSEEYNTPSNMEIWNIDYLDDFKEYVFYKEELPPIICGHIFYENEKFGGLTHNITKEDVKELGRRGVKHICLGHDHKDYPVEKIEFDEEKYIYVHRPGALIRKDIKKYNFERDIKIIYIDTNTMDYEYIKLNVEPFNNVLSNKKIFEFINKNDLEEIKSDVTEEEGLLNFLKKEVSEIEETEKEILEYVENLENVEVSNKIKEYLKRAGVL